MQVGLKKEELFSKESGVGSRWLKAKVSVDEENRKRKGSKLQDSNLADRTKRKELEEVAEDGHRASDIGIMINGVKLTYALRAILLTGFALLTDDYIDAVQHLIKELNTGVGGLNCIAATTHCSRFALPMILTNPFQCHNIGLHWVTSTSISGKVIVYKSLYRMVNESLKWQLVCMYKGCVMMTAP